MATEGTPPHGRPRGAALLGAVAAAVAVIISAPFMGEARRFVRDAFPGYFVAVVGTAIAITASVAISWALARIRAQRARRYALITAAIALAVTYSRASALGIPDSDVVELVHFVEYGSVTWLFYRSWRPVGDASSLWLTVLSGLTVGTFEEWFQWFLPARVGELRDVFLNLAAIVCGLLFSLAVHPPVSLARPGRGSLAWTYLVSALTLGALAGFVDSAHLGHEIRDPEIGVFRSLYSPDQLRAALRDRQDRWAADPPLTRPSPLSREDQYASEGLLHVQERNSRWSAGDVPAAWGENQVLEAYFAPTLDTPSYISRTGHRWPADQRAEAEHRAANGPGTTFVSRAFGAFPIFLWSRSRFRIYSTAFVGVLLGLAVGAFRRSAR